MALPNYQALMLPVLQIASQGESSVPLAASEIASRLGLSALDTQQILPSGQQTVFHNRLHWSKFYLKQAGLLQFPKRGRFAITSAGEQLLAHPPAQLNTQFLLNYPSFKAFYVGASASSATTGTNQTVTATATPEEVIDAARATLDSALRDELLDRVLQASPEFFERLIIELLVAMNYGGSRRDAARHLGKSGDGGVDGIINEDVLGLDRVFIQAKRFAPGNTVGRPQLQAFVGSLVGLGATKGVFVTTSSFADTAIQYVRLIPQRVSLIDGTRLTELMLEHDVGVRTSRVVAVKRLDEDFFTEE